MRQQRPETPQPNQPITAKWARQLQDLVVRNSLDVSACTGLDIHQTSGGTVIAVDESTLPKLTVGKVDGGGITARVGTTPGTGTVSFYQLNDSGVLEDSGDGDTVYSISSTTGGIPSGTYVMCEQDVNDDYWVVSVDCGN